MKRYCLYVSCLIVALFICVLNLYAQGGILKGIIKANKEPVRAATISTGKKTVLSNDIGEFSVSLAPGVYMITVSCAGYQSISKQIKIKAREITEREFDLQPIEQQLNTVVVLGSRSAVQRSNMNTTVPVDFIPGLKLPRSVPELTEQLNILVPSFNSPPQSVGLSASVVPAALRGLSPDETLVLINGRRRLSISSVYFQYSLAYGSVVTDLNSIPTAAIDNVQILRDGAAAQYGSDAIAGVIDLQLKKATGQTEINLHTGRFYKGDGETISLDINRGFSLKKKGFLNFTLASTFSNPTQRNGAYDSTVYYNIPPGASKRVTDSISALDDSTIMARGFDRLNHRPIGRPQIFNSSFVINGSYPLSEKTKLFLTGTFNYRYIVDRASGIYRYPKDSTAVIIDLYPDGFESKVYSAFPTISLIAGIEGENKKGWRWDISSTLGMNSNQVKITNTDNASQYFLGKNAQTQFDPGTTHFTQNTNNINFKRNFISKARRARSFNLSFGGEWRIEHFRIKAGEEASWKNYSPGSNRQWGSQGIGGYTDTNAVSKYRYISALYSEVEADISEKFLLNLAGRYEYYNDFSGNLAGKLAIRYNLLKHFSIRGSFSNGFRAPAMAQQYFSSTTNAPNRSTGKVVATETFRNDGKTAEAFGIDRLKAERSLSASGGITSTIFKRIHITLDAYWVQISNRITLTGSISKDNSPLVKNILSGLGKDNITAIRFFSNAISTHTRGIDLVATGGWLIKRSFLEVSLSGNYNKTKIYRVTQAAKKLPNDSVYLYTLINPEERGRLEQGQPLCKIILGMSYKTGKWEFRSQNIYFGKAAHIFSTADRTRDEFFSPKIISGCMLGYTIRSWVTIRAGAGNLFNNYPDKIKNKSNTQSGLAIYDFNGTQIGYNGGYYFINMNFNF